MEDAQIIQLYQNRNQAAWVRIPPEYPRSLRAFLGRIVRNISISRFRGNQAQKRCQPVGTLLAELEECVPDPHTVEETTELHELSSSISRWLDGLSPEDRVLFVRRYWYGDAVKDLARRRGCTANSLALRLHRLRQQLKNHLEIGRAHV